MKNQLFVSIKNSPVYNQSVEKILFDTCEEPTLFLSQNKNTVVLGKNQNAFTNHCLDLLSNEHLEVIRRNTGGRATYVDPGCLCFSFIAPKEYFDIESQLSLIQKSLSRTGLNPILTGQNNLVFSNGQSFLANTCYLSNSTCLHHGTIFIDANLYNYHRHMSLLSETRGNYNSKTGRTYFCNLSEINPAITINTVQRLLIQEFEFVYGSAHYLEHYEFESNKMNLLMTKYSSPDWIYGKPLNFNYTRVNHFSWGKIEMQFFVQNNTIKDIRVYSDTIDLDLIAELSTVLIGHPFDAKELSNEIENIYSPHAKELADWIGKKEL